MNSCNCLEVYGEITENCNVICPHCGGDMCQHEWEDIRKCKGLPITVFVGCD